MLERQIINGIEVYSISNLALKQYKENAHKDIHLFKQVEILERKLTGLILNAYEKKHVMNDKYMYRIGSFVMIVNEFTKKIEVVLWDTESHATKGLDKKKREKLKETYTKLGLNKKGNNFLKVKECVNN